MQLLTELELPSAAIGTTTLDARIPSGPIEKAWDKSNRVKTVNFTYCDYRRRFGGIT